MEYKKSFAKREFAILIISFSLILIVGLILRLYSWSHLHSLTWDEANHANPGIMLVRWLMNGLNFQYFQQLISHYPPAAAAGVFYPYGYPILAMFSFLIFGFSELAARLPSIVFSFLIIHAVYLLAKKLFGVKIALFSAFFAAINPWFILWGGRALVDVPMTALMIYALYFFIVALERNKLNSWVLSGIFTGFAFLMKPPGLLILPFLGLLLLYYKGFKGLFKRGFIVFSIILFLFLFSYFGFGIATKYSLPEIGLINYEYGKSIFDNTFHWFFEAATSSEPGDPTWKTLAGWTYYIKLLPIQLGGYLVLFSSLMGIFYLFKKKYFRSKNVLLLIFVLFIYIFFAILNNKNGRYTMSYLPIFCIFAGSGIAWVSTRFRKSISILIIGIFLSCSLLSSICTLPVWNIWETPESRMDEAAKIIISSPFGLVVAPGSDNVINLPTLTFYMLIKDKDLEYSSYWEDKIREAKYIVTNEKLNVSKGEIIFEKEDKLYVLMKE